MAEKAFITSATPSPAAQVAQLRGKLLGGLGQSEIMRRSMSLAATYIDSDEYIKPISWTRPADGRTGEPPWLTAAHRLNDRP